MRYYITLVAITVFNLFAEDLAPWSTKAHPGDARKQHIEEIGAKEHKYVVKQGGTVDGQNSRSPLGCGLSREGVSEQTWESNRSVRIENVGTTDIVNPWLSNGRNNLRTMDEMIASIGAAGMSDKDKAKALFFSEIQHRYHWSAGDNNELCDPVKVFNVYGYNTCGNDSICVAGLWKKAGLKAAPARAIGHCISQAFYDGRWHFFDGDMHTFYLLRDNETVAGELDLVRDHDLIKRSHTQGILLADNRASEERTASMYGFEGAVNGDRSCVEGTTMNMTLRPGEAIVWRWGHTTPPKARGQNPLYPDTICNGLWEYRPDFSNDVWKKGVELKLDNIKSTPDGLVAADGNSTSVTWRIRAPYVFVGGKIEADAPGAKFAFSADGKSYTDIAGNNFDTFFRTNKTPLYEYILLVEIPGTAKLKKLAIINDLQMAPRTLPEMAIGENAFSYSDQSGERKVRVTHEWIERSDSKPPAAPGEALNPRDGGEINGTAITFKWSATGADYLFELSDRADMKWPLSMNFYKLVSRTADKGQAQFTLPYPGLLNPDKVYYWHVRAKNKDGVWGEWSKTWSFTARAPGIPLDLKVDFDAAKNLATLKWKANPAGRAPVKYRVYGSDEKGFSISDAPYKVNVGVSKELSPQFAANFIAETSATEFAVLGTDVPLPAANKTYYRVVGIDDNGSRSGPSDYATAQRPVIFSKPIGSAKVGAEYRYQLTANRSLGDLRMQGGEVPSFWNIEKPKFAIQRGPNWLKIDANSGVLSGTPDAAGKFEVSVTALLEREVRKLDESALKWGNEKVLSTSTEKVGEAKQEFVIEVSQ